MGCRVVHVKACFFLFLTPETRGGSQHRVLEGVNLSNLARGRMIYYGKKFRDQIFLTLLQLTNRVMKLVSSVSIQVFRILHDDLGKELSCGNTKKKELLIFHTYY